MHLLSVAVVGLDYIADSVVYVGRGYHYALSPQGLSIDGPLRVGAKIAVIGFDGQIGRSGQMRQFADIAAETVVENDEIETFGLPVRHLSEVGIEVVDLVVGEVRDEGTSDDESAADCQPEAKAQQNSDHRLLMELPTWMKIQIHYNGYSLQPHSHVRSPSGQPNLCMSCITSVPVFQKPPFHNILAQMEESSPRWQLTDADQETSPKKGYFRNFLKSETRRFSSLVISNSISIEDKLHFKIFVLSLEKPPQLRTQEDQLATAKVLNEENIFPEFQNDLNVLRLFAKALGVRQCAPGEYLLTPKTKDEYLYKVIKGEVVRRVDGKSETRGKGELVERVEEFQVIKDGEVQCREETFLLAIHHKAYQEAMKIYLQNKITLKMLVKTALFSSFKRKELGYLLEKTQEKHYCSKDTLFSQGDPTNDTLYFLVEGEVLISKLDSQNSPQIVCYVGQGSLLGEQTLFQEKQRSYTAAVHSGLARIILISSAAFNDMLAHFQLPREQFFSQCRYGEFLTKRNTHYQQKLLECAQVKKIYRSMGQSKAIVGGRQQQMHDMLRQVQNYAMQLHTKEKLLQRKQLSRSQMISVETPLFGKDYAGWKQLGRPQGAQKPYCRLPHLH